MNHCKVVIVWFDLRPVSMHVWKIVRCSRELEWISEMFFCFLFFGLIESILWKNGQTFVSEKRKLHSYNVANNQFESKYVFNRTSEIATNLSLRKESYTFTKLETFINVQSNLRDCDKSVPVVSSLLHLGDSLRQQGGQEGHEGHDGRARHELS